MRRVLHHWPRVEASGDGGWAISGRVMTMERWVLIHAVCRLLVILIGVVLMAAGTVEKLSDGFGVRHIEGWPSELAWEVLRGLQGRYLHELPVSVQQFGWGVFLAGGALCGQHRALGWVIASGFLVTFGWLVKRHLAIDVTPEVLTVRRWGRRALRLSREGLDPGQLRLRIVKPEAYFSRFSVTALLRSGFLRKEPLNPPQVVEIVHGINRHRLLTARLTDEAEAIVLRVHGVLGVNADG